MAGRTPIIFRSASNGWPIKTIKNRDTIQCVVHVSTNSEAFTKLRLQVHVCKGNSGRSIYEDPSPLHGKDAHVRKRYWFLLSRNFFEKWGWAFINGKTSNYSQICTVHVCNVYVLSNRSSWSIQHLSYNILSTTWFSITNLISRYNRNILITAFIDRIWIVIINKY